MYNKERIMGPYQPKEAKKSKPTLSSVFKVNRPKKNKGKK